MIIGPLIVGIGPRPRLPGAALEMQRVFRVNPAVQVEPMVAVLRRGQDQLGLGQVAGIEIQRPRFWVPAELLIVDFPLVRRFLALDQLRRIDQPLEGEERLYEVRTHRGFVVGRLAMVEPLALERHRSPGVLGRLPRPIQSSGIAAERGQEEENGRMGLDHRSNSRDQTWSRSVRGTKVIPEPLLVQSLLLAPLPAAVLW